METTSGKFAPARLAGVLTLAAALFAAGAAAAQDKAAAKKHFDNGVELMGLEDFAGAAVEFEASIKVYQTRSAMFNLAMCYKAMHRYGQALDVFRGVLKTFGDEMNAEMKKEVRDNIAAINKLIGEVEIHTSVPGALVIVDGIQSGTTPLPAPLVLGAGEHRIRVSLQGYADQERVVALVSGGREVVSFQLAPAAAGSAPSVAIGSAPPPPVVVGSAPPPPAAAGPRITAGPAPELGRIFKLFGIRAGVQAGIVGVVALGIGLSQSDLGYEGIFGISAAVGAAGGGLLSWGIGNGSDDWDFPLWAAYLGSVAGGALAFGLDLGAYYGYGGDFEDMTFEEATNVVTIGILVTVILPPAVEAGAFALFRKPDAERFPNYGKNPEPAPAAPAAGGVTPADGAAPAAPPPPPAELSMRWRAPVPTAFADPDTGRLLYGFSFGAAF
jgi:hypothetical protein